MRGAFVRTLAELAEHDKRIVLLTGDLGYTAIEPFSDRFPERFINVGVAEQNMVGIATGLAEAGYIPFVYSIATFASLRPYEFIRNGPVLHHLPVRIVGIGGGFEYGPAGPTHHALEDVAIMRVQPGLTVIAPADHAQTRTAVNATWDLPGPIYYRLGKDDRTVVPGLDGQFELGRVNVIRPGRDGVFVTMGPVAVEALKAAEHVAIDGADWGVAIVSSLRPAPSDDLTSICRAVPRVITVEAHYRDGGVGSLVAEVIAEGGIPTRLERCAVERHSEGVTGSQRFLEGHFGLTAEGLAGRARGTAERARL